MKIIFSIIIPVYNVEKYLRECLDSVLLQSFNDFEVICVNDGSTDESLSILLEYVSKFINIVLIDCLNGGTASARNIGISKAQGDYIWFVDSDDWILKDSLTLLKNKIVDKSLDVLCFNGKLKYEETAREEQEEGFEENLLSGWDYYNKYALVQRKFHFVCVVIRLYRREFLINNNLYFENDIIHEDNLWLPKVMYYAQFVSVIPDSLYVYRIRKGSKMQFTSFKQIEDTIRVANMLSDFFIPIKNIEKEKIYREIAGEYFSAFLPETYKLYTKKYQILKMLIIWKNYKEVSIYPRHRRIYFLLIKSPYLFRSFIRLERSFKFLLNRL